MVLWVYKTMAPGVNAKGATMRRWGCVYLFTLMLLVCAWAWGVSYWRDVGAAICEKFVFESSVTDGSAYLFYGWGDSSSQLVVFNHPVTEERRSWSAGTYDGSDYHCLGFAFQPLPFSARPMHEGYLIAPLWLPTLLSGIGLLWAWRRKTRGDVKPKRGFPVGERPQGGPSAERVK